MVAVNQGPMRRYLGTYGRRIGAYAVAVAYATCGLLVTALSVKPLAGSFFMFQLAAVIGAALQGGLGPGLVAMVLSGIGTYALYFAPTLEAHEAYRLGSFVLVSVLFVWLAARTRRAKATAEEARARAEAAEAQARTIGAQQERLVAVVSHDLRNPLNAILVSAEHLQHDRDVSEHQARGLSRIVTSVRRMEAMIRDLLDYARARHGSGLPVHREAVRVGAICRTALEEVRTAYPSSTILLDVTGDDSATLDPARVEQVVCNLLTNALKHGAADAPVSVNVADESARVRIEVTNAGAPIPREMLSTLFDPFQPGGGTGSVGLGLFIVREIAHAHGGAVSVRTGEHGTTFTVVFPKGSAGTLARTAAG
jgi:signal transduction histidine kinase